MTTEELLQEAARNRLERRYSASRLLTAVQDRHPSDPVYAAAERWLGGHLRRLVAGHVPADPDAALVYDALLQYAEDEIREQEEREVRDGR